MPARAGALVLSIACTFLAGSGHAQNAAALAKAAARSADAFDTLVTPAALNALRRMADSLEAKKVETPAAATRASAAAPPRAAPAAPKRDVTTSPATAADRVATPAEPPPQTVADSARTITAIAARRLDNAVELRIVAAGRAVPALSEPFRAGEHSRLFITFDDAMLALDSPPALAEAGSLFAGVDIAEREGDVRIALDVVTLAAYEMEMTADTAVLRLAVAAGTEAAAEPALRGAGPDDLALARKAARAGWAAFRADVASVASSVGGFSTNAAAAMAGAAASAWHATSTRTVAVTGWLAGSIPFAAIARTLVLLALLGAPPVFALRFFRRRQSAVRAAAPAGIADPETHARAAVVASKIEKQAKPRKEKKARKVTVTRTTADARLWAARTLAENGADVAEIARQTGLSREAAILLVRRAGAGPRSRFHIPEHGAPTS